MGVLRAAVAGSRGAHRADLQSGDAERRAIATRVMTGGTSG